MIRFGYEKIFLDNWSIHAEYTAFRAFLGPGMTTHLTNNILLRAIFGLGGKKVFVKIYGHHSKRDKRQLMKSLNASRNRDKRTADFC